MTGREWLLYIPQRRSAKLHLFIDQAPRSACCYIGRDDIPQEFAQREKARANAPHCRICEVIDRRQGTPK